MTKRPSAALKKQMRHCRQPLGEKRPSDDKKPKQSDWNRWSTAFTASTGRALEPAALLTHNTRLPPPTVQEQVALLREQERAERLRATQEATGDDEFGDIDAIGMDWDDDDDDVDDEELL